MSRASLYSDFTVLSAAFTLLDISLWVVKTYSQHS